MNGNWRARWAQLKARLTPMRAKIRRTVPRGLRLIVGILLICGGILGFLPVLGFWMIPLGIMVAAMDIRLFQRWRRAHQKNRADSPTG